jgi:glucose/arabinose dehydrogenase
MLLAVLVGLLAGSLSLLYLDTKPVSAVAPSGFTDQLVASVLKRPTALAFTPDGRLLVANQNGKLLVYENGALRTTPALDISANICSAVGERGLAGIAVDPNFADALALVGKQLWAQEEIFHGSLWETDTVKVPRAFVERLTEAVSYAA